MVAVVKSPLSGRERFRYRLAELDRAALRKFAVEVVATVRSLPIEERLPLLPLETLVFERCEEAGPSGWKAYPSKGGRPSATRLDGTGLWWEVWEAGNDRAGAPRRERAAELLREYGNG